MANITFKLNGNVVEPVKDWQDLQVLGTWSETGGEANISVEEFTFVNENAELINNYIADGLVGGLGIYEGLPFDIEYTNGSVTNIFGGVLDTTTYKQITPVEIQCKIKKLAGIDQLIERAQGVTYAFLYDEGFLTDSDFSKIPYIKEKPFKESAGEMALLSLSIFLFTKQLIDATKSLIDKLGINATAHTIGGISGPAAGVQYTLATLIAEGIYTGVILVQLLLLIDDLFEILYPQLRGWKGMKFQTLLEKGCQYLGYTYQSSIEELPYLYILPSKNDEGKRFGANNDNSVGYPDTLDFGYTIAEMFDLVGRMFKARIKIVGNVVYQEPLINDNFWVQQSTYTIPDIENEVIQYNADQIKTRTIVRYETDLADYWTILRYNGTGIESLITPITTNNQKAVLIKGFSETIIPYAMGDRKLGLNPIEGFFKILAGILDSVINFFGGNSDRKGDILSRKQMLHVTGDNLTKGKILYLTEDPASGRLVIGNNRQKIEAQTLFNKYISEDDFVAHNFRGQKRLFEDLKIPFGFPDFIQLLNNSYCTDQQGNTIKIDTLKWSFDKDYALISGWQRKVFSTNLKRHIFIGLRDQI